MKMPAFICSVIIIAAAAVSSFAAGQDGFKRYHPGRLIVRYKDVASFSITGSTAAPVSKRIEEIGKRHGLKKERPLYDYRTGAGSRRHGAPARVSPAMRERIDILSFDSQGADMEALAREYMTDPNVEYAQPDYLLEVAAIPNDTLYAGQWAHPVMDSPDGWDISTGSGAVIAVIDTGVDWNHPDLAANIWTNPGEIAGNGLDDDGNGYADDFRGWDFVDFYYAPSTGAFAVGEDCDWEDYDPMDFYGHGTIVAGVAAAVGNNAAGVCGTSYTSKIMALRVGVAESTSGGAYILTSWCAKAMRYAADNGADVINFSIIDPNWTSTSSTELRSAVDYAYSRGCVIVAGAGNRGECYPPSYPAGYSKVIGVAATDPSDQRSIWGAPDPYPHESDYGTWVKVAAPGSGITSTAFNDGYSTSSGTSLSTAFVSGVAALIKANNPAFTNEEIMRAVYSTTDRVNSDKYIGSGRVNVLRALQMTAVPQAEITYPAMEQAISTNVVVTGTAYCVNFASYTLKYGAQYYPAAWTTIETGLSAVTNGTLATWDISSVGDNNFYTLRLEVTDLAGNTAVSEKIIYVQKSVASGWPRTFSGIYAPESIVTGDLDGDNDQEMAFVMWRGLGGPSYTNDLHVLHHNGAEMVGWPRFDLNGSMLGAPAFANLTGSGARQIVVSGHTWDYPTCTTKFHVFDTNGAYMPGWPKVYISSHGFTSATPTVADIDNDGFQEMIFPSAYDSYGKEAKIFIYRYDGSVQPGWPKTFTVGTTALAGQHASHAVTCDLDGDGDLEIIVGIVNYPNSNVHAFHHDGTTVSGWPITLATAYVPHVVAGDLDNDSNMEIVGAASSGSGGLLYVWNASGSLFSGWPAVWVLSAGISAPSLADIDGDNDLEILVNSGSNKIYAFHHNRTLAGGWPVSVSTGSYCAGWAPPLATDIDGDNDMEIVSMSNNATAPAVYAWHGDGTPLDGWPKITPVASAVSPAIWDFDNDGFVEMALSYATTVDLWRLGGAYQRLNMQWPMKWGDMTRKGVYAVPDVVAPVASVEGLQPGAVVSGQILLSANASDNQRVIGVRFRCDGVGFNATDSSAPYTTLWDTTLVSPGTHTVTVSAWDLSGNVTISSGVAVTILDILAPTAPAAPEGVSVSSVQVNIAWSPSYDIGAVSGYGVYRLGVFIASTTQVSFQDTGLDPGTTYTYYIIAYDAAGNISGSSISISVFTLAAGASTATDSLPPTVPENVAITPLSPTEVMLSWESSSDNVSVAGYRVYRNDGLIATPSGAGCTDAGLQTGGDYAYCVEAYDTSGNYSGRSAPVSINLKVSLKIPDRDFAYPVPFVGGRDSAITIANLAAHSKVEIYSIEGNLVHESETEGASYSFIPADLSSGVYFYIIRNGPKVSSGKIVIMK